MLNNNLNVLITRPEIEGRRLAEKLNTLGIASHSQPMFDYQVNHHLLEDNASNLAQLLNKVNQPLVIFISVAAVTSAHTLINLTTWQPSKVFAIGTATAQALKALNIDAISPEVQTSEGLLTLTELQCIQGKDIIIVRGNGGRECLAENLNNKGARVHYVEAYQRIWRQLSHNIEQDWRSLNINCMVITSDALLQSVVQLINLSDKYWRNNCFWVVVSERIAHNARLLGLQRVINSGGASDNVIINAITSDALINMENNDDR